MPARALARGVAWSLISAVLPFAACRDDVQHQEVASTPAVEATATSPPEVPRVGSGKSAAQPAPATVEAARQALSGNGGAPIDASCGPYRVLTTALPRYLEACRSIVGKFESVYQERLGTTTRHAPGGLILLFGSGEPYRTFAATSADLRSGYAGFSRASRGVIAIVAEDLPLDRFATVLAHELSHLAHRRVFRSALPPWLSEGLADAVGDTATPTGFAALDGNAGKGPLAERLRLAHSHDNAEPVAAVMIKSRRKFDRGTVSFDYETSALLVRFLLTDSELGPRFRDALRDIAAGPAMSSAARECDLLCIFETLGTDGRELDRRFRTWIGY